MKILFVEGLGSYYFLNYLKNGMMPYFVGHQLERRSWTDQRPTDADAIIGHSLGAGIGLEIARRSKHKTIPLVVTLDPRVTGKPFQKPGNVDRVINFYRDKALWMPGYYVKGAENHPIKGISHGGLCFDTGIRKQILDAVRGITS